MLFGRSPDLRVAETKRLPGVPVAYARFSPLTVAGAVAVSAPFGSSSPHSLLGSLPFGFEHRTLALWQDAGLPSTVHNCAIMELDLTAQQCLRNLVF